MRSAEETGAGADQSGTEMQIRADHHTTVTALCAEAFGAGRFQIERLTDVNRGRGAFSVVLRAELAHDPDAGGAANPNGGQGEVPNRAWASKPSAVVAKLPVDGPNGEAAVAGGAYAREALAYRSIVQHSPIRTPALYAIQQPTEGTSRFLLEDLSPFRAADQLDGLDADDALAVAATLSQLHRSWQEPDRLAGLSVRRNTVAGLAPDALQRGLEALSAQWAEEVSDHQRATYARLVRARQGLVERFEAATPTLCHGDPRADNLAFDDQNSDQNNDQNNDQVILFDWQQLAVQFGEADLAWLAATSLSEPARRRLDEPMVSTYGGDLDRYRLGFALPGLAVLMLAQRQFPTERARRFVSVSLQRIAAALDDLEVAALG